MRLPLLALLCCATAAFSQSPAGPRVDPDKLFQMPEKFSQAAPGFGKFKPLPAMKNDLILALPPMTAPRPKFNDRQIDPKMILHPPWRGESKGSDVSRNLYPNLKFLPIGGGRPVR